MRGRKPDTIVPGTSTVAEVPKPPTWLSRDAKAEWRRIMPQLVERRVLTDADMGLVEAFCVSLGRVREIERAIQASAGALDPRLFRMQDKAIQTSRQIAAEIGATPVSRSRPAVRDGDADDLGFLG
jgi:P27 family predicted phage terminase small subunit